MEEREHCPFCSKCGGRCLSATNSEVAVWVGDGLAAVWVGDGLAAVKAREKIGKEDASCNREKSGRKARES